MEKMKRIHKLLSQRKFKITDDVDDDYICRICKEILINPHQSICGCQFCYECINQYMNNGGVSCQNNTEECQRENLTNIVANHRLNQKISKLLVRCPNKFCNSDYRLIEIEEHLIFCTKKGVRCPFNDIGCEHDDDIDNDKLNDHMLSDINNHNKILINLIGNLKNELVELKEKVKENRLEIEILKENDLKKNKIIESLKDEIIIIKQDNEDLRQQTEIGDRNLWYKFDKIDIEMKEKCSNESMKLINNEMKIIKEMKNELEEKIEIVEKNIDEKYNMEIDRKLCEIRRDLNEQLKNTRDKMREENDKHQLQIENQFNKIDKYLNMLYVGNLILQIGSINQINMICSECFYSKQNPYKMQLQLENINNELNISLLIGSGAFDDDLKWPCQANVAIYIIALNDENNYKLMTKSIKIEKPKPSSQSDPIKITHSDLTKSNLFNMKYKLEF